MRILALTNLYPNASQPHRASFNRQQFAALGRQHEVRVIAPIAWTDEWTAGPQPTQLRDGMIVHHPRYYFTPKVLRGWYGNFFLHSVRACFRQAVTDFSPDVVLGCWAYPDGWAAVRLAREMYLPVAIKVHGSDVLTVRESTRRSRTIEALQGADAVITVSQHLAEQVVAMGVPAQSVNVVYNGVDTQLFRPGSRSEARTALGLSPDGNILLFVGNLVLVKGLDVLIDACASLARSGLPFRCLLIGDGPLKTQLRSEIARRRLEDHVQLLGPKPLEQLPMWYRAANLLVLPSHSEGVPNVLLEAAACGTPFVASAVGGIPEISPSTALFPAGDAGALAEKIRSTLCGEVPPKASDFPSRGWENSAGGLAAVLQNVVDNSAITAKAS